MANQQDDRSSDQFPDGGSGQINAIEAACVQLGRTGSPPRPLVGKGIPKQWQPPKNESTPSNRTKKE